jgi:hypothetical protein
MFVIPINPWKIHVFLCRAFKDKDNHYFLNQFFGLTFQRLLLTDELINHGAKQSKFSETFFDSLQGVRAIVVPPETKVSVFSVCNSWKCIAVILFSFLLHFILYFMLSQVSASSTFVLLPRLRFVEVWSQISRCC